MPKRDYPIEFNVKEIERAAIVLTIFTEFFGSEGVAIDFMRQHPGTRFEVPDASLTERMLAKRQLEKRIHH